MTMRNQQLLFTGDQISGAHSKVKSGADFPAYIQDLKELGVTHYETFVHDGHTDYFGYNGHKITSAPKYSNLPITETSNKKQFQTDLKLHQEGKTDYPTFCKDCAESGIKKWAVHITKMTCTYYDKAGNRILVEQIPK